MKRPSEDAEYDAEIAAIFTEESAELLESADKALVEWIKERSAQPMDELKRHLHTLKGGARMAGITAMGNLSHEIETLSDFGRRRSCQSHPRSRRPVAASDRRAAPHA